ncbi:MAG: hypothetical protein Q4D60_05585 [Eubacteriales bacterium]|nr:hypothetical protein [Eubacteriales bacterium]
MKKMKNNLDERQELKLLKIEHTGCWIAFWGLLAIIFIQKIMGNNTIENLIGEWTILSCLSIYLVIGCIKNGIWDRRLKPDFRTNAIVSSITALAMGVIWFIISYRNYHKLTGSVAAGVFMFLTVLVLCLAALTISSKMYKKRLQKLEELEEDSVDED